MRRDGPAFPVRCNMYNVQLWHDRHGFKPYRERPESFHDTVVVLKGDAKCSRNTQQILDTKGFHRQIVGRLVLDSHQVQAIRGRRDKEYLHGNCCIKIQK